jgi:DNA-binding CsgD family transcriptional regulator
LGVSEEDFIQKGFSQFLQTIPLEAKCISAVQLLFSFLFDSFRDVSIDVRNGFIAYAYGIKHLRLNGKSFPTMTQLYGLEYDGNGLPTLCFFIDQDIDHLAKPSDQYWGRVSFNKGELVRTFSSKDMELKKQDVFSGRELEVLKLLLKGYESKQIAEKLYISSNTVDNHRKNMIRKLNARDTTALVQLAKLFGILR